MTPPSAVHRWMRSSRTLAVVVAVLVVALRAPAGQAAPAPALQVVGTRVLPVSVAREAAGTPPAARRERAAWAKQAARRVARAYSARGYRYARAWGSVTPEGAVQIEVDEGRMHRIVFSGTSAFHKLLYRVDLGLPHDVFHRPTLRRALDELRVKHGLASVYYRVRGGHELVATVSGKLVRQRVLHVFVVSRESYGWGFGLSLSSAWGLLPTLRYTHRDLLLSNDRFGASLAVGLPYRRYFFDAEPTFQWVYGRLAAGYRLPPFLGGRVAPLVDGHVALPHQSRGDLGLDEVYTMRSAIFASLAVILPPVAELALGAGVDYTNVFSVERSEPEAPREGDLVRYVVRLLVDLDLDPHRLRRDLRDRLRLESTASFTENARWTLDLRAAGMAVYRFGRHELVLRGRALYVGGSVRFWDERSLAGEYLRVFFGGRWWVREAVQLTSEFRLAVWQDVVKLGVFNDLSVFGDRTGGDPELAAVDGFGPSLHFLLYDLFALDMYYGFGFGPPGFAHNFSFRLESVF